MSSFISLYTAFSGLQAAQTGIDTTSNNIANAGEDGYTRQRVDLASRISFRSGNWFVGQGVDVVGISRARNAFLDARLRDATGLQGEVEVAAGLFSALESVLGEPDNGITHALEQVWSAFEELALDPPDTAARLDVLSELEALTSRVVAVAEQWQSAGDAASLTLGQRVDRTNELLEQVAALNVSILATEPISGSPNDLLDKRDVALDELSRISGVHVSTADDGTKRVSLNGMGLVSGATASLLTYDSVGLQVLHASGAAVQVGGELAGYQSFLTTDLPGLRTTLDTFVEELATALNTQHAAGLTPAGAAGGNLLTFVPGNAAITAAVVVTDPAQLAAATTGPPVPRFDGTNAGLLAGLRFAQAGGGGTRTLSDSIRSLVSDVAGRTSTARASAASQLALTAAADAARMSAHGVALDEEMVSLINYQRSYEASARMMTAIDQALDTLINRTGLVGR